MLSKLKLTCQARLQGQLQLVVCLLIVILLEFWLLVPVMPFHNFLPEGCDLPNLTAGTKTLLMGSGGAQVGEDYYDGWRYLLLLVDGCWSPLIAWRNCLVRQWGQDELTSELLQLALLVLLEFWLLEMVVRLLLELIWLIEE